MKVVITNSLGALGQSADPQALIAAFTRAVHFGGTGDDNIVEILCYPRDSSGWLEYHLSFKHAWGAQRFLIAVIQREPGAEFEFHS